MTDAMTEEALFELLSLDCRVDSEGTLLYCNALGQLHRIHGPAIICTDGYRAWYHNGQLYRADGPAIEYSTAAPLGSKTGNCTDWVALQRAWHINGKALTEAEWQQQVASMEDV